MPKRDSLSLSRYSLKTILTEENLVEENHNNTTGVIRTITWRIAVKNPWGLKKPVIQKHWGRPLKTQEVNWQFLSRSSVNQKPNVLETHDA